jgi:peptide/nickel transport system substrate-binding protein
MKRRLGGRTVLVGAAAMVVALGMSACQGSANNNNSSGGSSVLTIQGDAGNPTLVKNFNPFSSNQLGGTRLIYEPLEIPSQVDGTFEPFLATGFKATDSTTLEYAIRSGVKWSDGKDFTAADVVFTFNLLKKYPALDITGVWPFIDSVSASGSTVTVKLKAPNVPAANTISAVPIVPEHLWSSVADPVKYVNADPVGTGPVTLDTYADTQYQLKKNPSYWQADKIVPTTVVFPAQSSNQATNQLDVSSGKFDWSYNFIPDVKNTYVAKDTKTNIYWFPPGGTIALYPNQTKAPFDDVNFRQGMSLALDRKTIEVKAVNGYTGPASQSGLILPNLAKFLDPTLADQGQVKQDLAGAKAAFAKAGYVMQGSQLVKGGAQASVTILAPASYSDWVAAATEVKTELGAVGVKVTLNLPQAAAYQQAIQSGNFDVALGGFGGTGNVYSDFNNAFNSKFATAINTPTSNNFERYKNPQMDTALAAFAAATDMPGQEKAAHQLQQLMFNQVPIVCMYYGGSWGLFRTDNFTGWPSAADPYTLPTPYNNAVLVVLTHLKKA